MPRGRVGASGGVRPEDLGRELSFPALPLPNWVNLRESSHPLSCSSSVRTMGTTASPAREGRSNWMAPAPGNLQRAVRAAVAAGPAGIEARSRGVRARRGAGDAPGRPRPGSARRGAGLRAPSPSSAGRRGPGRPPRGPRPGPAAGAGRAPRTRGGADGTRRAGASGRKREPPEARG